MKTFLVKENCTLKEFTDFNYPQGSFVLSRLLKNRDIKVNGARVSSDLKLFAGDEVCYYTTPAQEGELSHSVVFEDENVLICDKFSGVASEGLLSELNRSVEVFAVHRLDRNTSGLIVFAKNKRAEEELLRAFKERAIEKTYLALCKNCFRSDAAVLKAYLKKDADGAYVKVSDRECGERIVTQYKVLEKRGDIALVEVALHTGKTHQIRAHMAHIGCPVLGDEKYGDSALNKKYGARRQRLVAKYLKFNLSGKLSYLNNTRFESNFTPEI